MTRATLLATLGLFVEVGVAMGQPAPGGPRGPAPTSPQPKGNAAAQELSQRALRLGIDFDPENPKAEHPSRAEADALDSAAAFRWLTDQLGAADDSIAPVPEGLQHFLATRRDALWSVVGLLERETPEWSSPRTSETAIPPRFPALNRLNRLLVAAALAEQRAGSTVEAGRLLEASWSIHRSLSKDSDAASGAFLASAVMRLEVGALRKLQEPSRKWLDRLARQDPWQQAIDDFEIGALALAAGDPSAESDPLLEGSPSAHLDVHRAAKALRTVSPCDFPGPFAKEVGHGWKDRLAEAGRLAVDAELTLKILELRLGPGLREEQWPPRLGDESSHVCAGARYGYRRIDLGMEIEFRGSAPASGTGYAPPLSYSTREERRLTPASRARRSAPDSN